MIRLTLPVPPSVNSRKRHPMALHRQAVEYKRDAWIAALSQHKPVRDPPKTATISATLYYAKHPRDEDGAMGSLKWAIDCLKQKQTGDVAWRQGIADQCGYFVDDDPASLTVEKPEQVKVAKVKEERLEVTIRVGQGLHKEAA